jgi:hypothetical protein
LKKSSGQQKINKIHFIEVSVALQYYSQLT